MVREQTMCSFGAQRETCCRGTSAKLGNLVAFPVVFANFSALQTSQSLDSLTCPRSPRLHTTLSLSVDPTAKQQGDVNNAAKSKNKHFVCTSFPGDLLRYPSNEIVATLPLVKPGSFFFGTTSRIESCPPPCLPSGQTSPAWMTRALDLPHRFTQQRLLNDSFALNIQ